MKIISKLKEYEVSLERNPGFFETLAQTPNAQFVIDRKVFGLYREFFLDIPEERIYLIDAEERCKVIDTALGICERISEIPAKRNAVLISIGGGIIQDITGFAANIIYRGIRWIYVPTTLLAACDSCIGGKTSLNYKKYKNLLGTFYPPDKIHIFSEMFRTLSEKDFKSGLGEVIKFNIMSGEKGLDNIEKNIHLLLERDPETIDVFVRNSLEYKRPYIEKDEFDRGERIKLNFAHTFGHAIETVTEYDIPHGTAVAIGMIMADYVSAKRGYISDELKKRSENVLLQVIDIGTDLLGHPLSDYLMAIRKDKKQVGSSLTAVLMKEYGEAGELAVVHDLQEDEIKDAVSYFMALYGADR